MIATWKREQPHSHSDTISPPTSHSIKTSPPTPLLWRRGEFKIIFLISVELLFKISLFLNLNISNQWVFNKNSLSLSYSICIFSSWIFQSNSIIRLNSSE